MVNQILLLKLYHPSTVWCPSCNTLPATHSTMQLYKYQIEYR